MDVYACVATRVRLSLFSKLLSSFHITTFPDYSSIEEKTGDRQESLQLQQPLFCWFMLSGQKGRHEGQRIRGWSPLQLMKILWRGETCRVSTPLLFSLLFSSSLHLVMMMMMIPFLLLVFLPFSFPCRWALLSSSHFWCQLRWHLLFLLFHQLSVSWRVWHAYHVNVSL